MKYLASMKCVSKSILLITRAQESKRQLAAAVNVAKVTLSEGNFQSFFYRNDSYG